MEPNPYTWKLFGIQVECYCASYQEAKQKAAQICPSTIEEESVHCQLKPNKKYNSDQYNLDFSESNCSHDELTSPPTLNENDFHERVATAFTSNTNICEGNNYDCCRKFDILIKLLIKLNVNVRDLKETLNNKQTIVSHEEAEAISSKLPLQSIKEMVQLDILEQNKKQKDSLISILLSIGGLSGKDFTQRILRMLMTNDVAELCSWTGAKHNYVLQ